MHSDKNQQLLFVLQTAEGTKRFILPPANKKATDGLRHQEWINC
jgi:hypothetical protein